MSGITSGRHTAWKRNKEMYVLPVAEREYVWVLRGA